MLSTFGFRSSLPTCNHPHFRACNTDFSRHTYWERQNEEGVFGEIQCHIGEESSKATLSLLLHACYVQSSRVDTGEQWLGRQQEAAISVRAAHRPATWLGLHGFSATFEQNLPFHRCCLTAGIGLNEFYLFLSWCLNLLLGLDFKIMCACGYLCICMENVRASRVQKALLNLLELSNRLFVSCLIWMLETDLSARTVLNCWAISALPWAYLKRHSVQWELSGKAQDVEWCLGQLLPHAFLRNPIFFL